MSQITDSPAVLQRQSGRPRDETTDAHLLAAARRLVIRDGYRAVTIDSIVTEAGVARQTFYRRWPGKAELVLDAFVEGEGLSPQPAREALEDELCSFLTMLFENLRRDGPAIRSLIASAQDDPKFLESFRTRFVEPRVWLGRAIFERAATRGELAGDADIGAALDALYGAFWYRLLLGETLDDAYARGLAVLISRSVGYRRSAMSGTSQKTGNVAPLTGTKWGS
ncbi:TetR/AcrR family transcriptional regulator [Asaia sp. BMEF1]|uniref:TetR/AcrR family transcriptional regulator n=1 Tax=Asaia sp. BMEF1 TaxID=3155932 RepID=UPI003F671226